VNKRFYALGRLKSGQQNKLEAEYDAFLNQQLQAGQILWYRFEGIKLRLADNTFLTMDFAVMNADCRLELHDVKGFFLDDAKVKVKVAADQYPFHFVIAYKRPKKDGGGWKFEDF
jgi:hypothetical protein